MERLSKVLARAGVASRRSCETLIFEGKVRVNGEIVTVPQTKVSLGKDTIEVSGRQVKAEEEKVYFLINKPKGYLCSNRRQRNSKLVIDLFGKRAERLFTVGRLDRDTTGLLIVTNDGHFANKVMHPSSNISKEYIAETDKDLTPRHLKRIEKGCVVEGVRVMPRSVKKLGRRRVGIVVMEGRKREVRRLVEHAGLEVEELTRTRIGGMRLEEDLTVGSHRPLTAKDRELLLKPAPGGHRAHRQKHRRPVTGRNQATF